MKTAYRYLFLLCLPLTLSAYTTDPDSGLLFNETKYKLADATDKKIHHGVQTALLVAPEDMPERAHYSNSNMARIELLAITPGGGAYAYTLTEDGTEQVFIVLEGRVEFTAAGEKLAAGAQDIVFVPPGLERSFTAVGGTQAKVLQAEWRQKGAKVPVKARAYVTSENLASEKLQPPAHTDGYLTVTPNPRQKGIPLSIVGYGGHTNASHSLQLYPLDLPDRSFTANTVIARMGLSAYGAGGGTPPHVHPDREQCFVILAGKGLFEIGTNTIEVKAGDMVFAPRHVWHGYKTTGEEPLKFLELEWGRK